MKIILIIGNGKAIRNMISSHLRKPEYRILDSDDNINCRRFNCEHVPDLVIADLTSLKNESIRLLLQLKKDPYTAFIPFLFITSSEEANNQNSYMRNERHFSIFDHYLIKPFNEYAFIDLIKKLLNQVNNMSPW